jgi:hypothetical protein
VVILRSPLSAVTTSNGMADSTLKKSAFVETQLLNLSFPKMLTTTGDLRQLTVSFSDTEFGIKELNNILKANPKLEKVNVMTHECNGFCQILGFVQNRRRQSHHFTLLEHMVDSPG